MTVNMDLNHAASEEAGPAHEQDRQFVTALARGLNILEAFTVHDRELSNHEIAERTGLARPTVSRLTHTLTVTGHLEKGAESGGYRLTARAMGLGFSALCAMEPAERYKSEMEKLCAIANPYASIALARQEGLDAIYIALRRTSYSIVLALQLGARLPLFHSSIGRAALAALDEQQQEELTAAAIAREPDGKDRILKGLKTMRHDIERFGYCTSFGDWRPEINAVAAPIPAPGGPGSFGMNVGGPAFLISPDDLHEQFGEPLREAARRLGFRGAG